MDEKTVEILRNHWDADKGRLLKHKPRKLHWHAGRKRFRVAWYWREWGFFYWRGPLSGYIEFGPLMIAWEVMP